MPIIVTLFKTNSISASSGASIKIDPFIVPDNVNVPAVEIVLTKTISSILVELEFVEDEFDVEEELQEKTFKAENEDKICSECIKTIEDFAFIGCKNLININLDWGN